MRSRSAWPTFHRLVILPYILKFFYRLMSYFGIMWPNLWPQNKCYDPSDLYFAVQWFCLISWRLFDWWTYFWIMSQCDRTFDIIINVGQHDLYFPVQWFYLISWRLFDWWTYFGIKSQCDLTFDFKINLQWPIFHGPVILPYILKAIWWMNMILSDDVSVWHSLCPHNKCRSACPIFHFSVILPYILNAIWWRNIILLDNESVWLKDLPHNKCRSQCPIFHGPAILLHILKCFMVEHWTLGWLVSDLIINTGNRELSCAFASYLEERFMDECHTLGWRNSVMQ